MKSIILVLTLVVYSDAKHFIEEHNVDSSEVENDQNQYSNRIAFGESGNN